ncbi:hypothetical protein [Streptomyces sp. NBC_00063]|uniref:P-type ATPase n=1 Tax=Streptomyces sp. NBC_00063 TaxID=2975638 RepID=UPI003D74D493
MIPRASESAAGAKTGTRPCTPNLPGGGRGRGGARGRRAHRHGRGVRGPQDLGRRTCHLRRGSAGPGGDHGEALPVYARAGTHVYAGTIVTSGSLTVRAESVGRDTTVGRIVSRVEEAQSDRAPIQTVAARFT